MMGNRDARTFVRYAVCLCLALSVSVLPGIGACAPQPPAGGDGSTDGGGNDGGSNGSNPPGGNGGNGGDGGGGQPPPPVARVTADAGPDQTVEDRAVVTLSGRGTDSTGAAVSHAWSQVGGPPVTLLGADGPTATFTAPDVTASLMFRLRVQSANGEATDDVVVAVDAAPMLFVANRGGNTIARFRAGRNLNGDVAPLALLAGANTRLNNPSSIQLDRIGGLLVTNVDANRIAGFLNALTIDGDVTPERYVGGPATLLNYPEGAAYSPTADLLFVANFDSFPGTVNVYGSVATPGFTGSVAPIRQIRSYGIVNARDLELTAGDELYVANAGANNVSVFANAGTADGLVTASRIITSPEFQDRALLDVWLDSNGRMFVLDGTYNRVLSFANAATLNGDVVPDAIITVPNAGQLAGVAVDAKGTGYVADFASKAIYIFESITGRSGVVQPDRTIMGPKTQLSGPWHMHLLLR